MVLRTIPRFSFRQIVRSEAHNKKDSVPTEGQKQYRAGRKCLYPRISKNEHTKPPLGGLIRSPGPFLGEAPASQGAPGTRWDRPHLHLLGVDGWINDLGDT